MIRGCTSASPYFLHNQKPFEALDGVVESTLMPVGGGGEQATSMVSDARCHALLYNLSVLKERVQQLQPLVDFAVAHDGAGPAAVSGAGAVIQEIIAAASSMMYAFQQLSLGPMPAAFPDAVLPDAATANHGRHHHAQNSTTASYAHDGPTQGASSEVIDRGSFGGSYSNKRARPAMAASPARGIRAGDDGIIELDAAELLAKYTHYCQVCGKGFKRDANLRMHMRAHGDEYKTNAALANPSRASGEDQIDMSVSAAAAATGRKYSCPHEGCRFNRRHAKFQPLKSVVCVKNHYKRSHCPKMYVCKRCNRKQFSVLSDLRTHEKHCGDQRWLCSCGTTFSRKDKLMGHVSLFAGHAPAVPVDCSTRQGKRPEPGNGNGMGVGIGMT